MPLSLICACGARIELEDALAGQEVACPECQQPLKAPAGAGQSHPIRTSGLALASLVLAITGAFTVVGTAVAVVLGLVAIVMILRQRDRLAGLGYAFAGIAVGGLFTLLTLVAFITAGPLGLAGYVRERNMAGLVDTTGPQEVVDRTWAITRPTQQWGVGRTGLEKADPIADLFFNISRPDVTLVEIKHNAFVDIHEESATGKTLANFKLEYLGEYQATEENQYATDRKGKEVGVIRIEHGQKTHERTLVTMPSGSPPLSSGYEAEMEIQAAGQKWVLLIRIYHNPKRNSFYILRAYTPRRYYTQNKDEFEKALDSFRFVP